MTWVTSAFIGMLIMASYSMFVPFMLKNYGLTGAVTATFWLLGSALGLIVLGRSVSEVSSAMVWQIILVTAAGFIFGALMNFAITNAFILAPNPAYPMSILNLSAATTLLVAPVLYYFFSDAFAAASISVQGILGVSIAFLGIYLVITA